MTQDTTSKARPARAFRASDRRETHPHRIWRAMVRAGCPLDAHQLCARAGIDNLATVYATLSQMARDGYATKEGTSPQTYSPLTEPPQPGPGRHREVAKLRIATVRAALAGDVEARTQVERVIGGEA